jgi:hypothetical protein
LDKTFSALESKLLEGSQGDEDPSYHEDDNDVVIYGERFEVTDEIAQYLQHAFDLLVLRRYYINTENLAKTSRSSSINATLQSLSRWCGELAQHVCLPPRAMNKAAKGSMWLASQQSLLILFGKFMQKSPLWKYYSVRGVWDILAADDQMVKYLSDVVIISKGKDDFGGNANIELRFSEPQTIYKDKDILQAFCLSSKDTHQVAMATTRGIREVTLTTESLFKEEDEDNKEIKEVMFPKNAFFPTEPALYFLEFK